MNTTREVICFDCENALVQYEKTHSNKNLKPLYNEYKALTEDIDQKVSLLKARINPIEHIEVIEGIYKGLQKQKIINSLIVKKGYNLEIYSNSFKASVQSVDGVTTAIGFSIYHAVSSPSCHIDQVFYSYTVPDIYKVLTFPLTAGILGCVWIQGIANCVIDCVHPEENITLNNEMLSFFSILHKIQKMHLFKTLKTHELLEKAKSAYEKIPTHLQSKFPIWIEWENGIKEKLSIS